MRSAAKKEKEKSCYKLERKCSFVAVSSSTLVPYFSLRYRFSSRNFHGGKPAA